MTDDLMGADVRPTASYTLRVNGFERPVSDAWIGESLLYVLRERLGLAGAKDGCEQGECGACSVQVDGQLVAGCLVPAALASDSEIATVEGLSAGGAASDVQQALADSGAVQCGYCTPGMAMAVHDLLQRNHRPSEVETRQALCGNLCRCTGYQGVLAAVQTVAEARGVVEEPVAADPSAEAAVPVAQPVPVLPAQSAADLPLAGEHPLYADSEVWVEAEPQPAAREYAATTHQTGVYEPDYSTPYYDPAPYDPGFEAPYETGRHEATPAHGTAADGPVGTPAHGTPYYPTPAHGTSFDGPDYDAPPVYDAPAYDGTVYDGNTPPHGIRLPEDDRA
ncbi:(2Fe-2S)-binding protein [Kitasatospora sp. NPDC101801]|uniref:(2Fe-2S)-binding protein n=1 Tax=Kitasatospora sp. NPDC101801 TaxID=3364103 RepID=UPI003805BB23